MRRFTEVQSSVTHVSVGLTLETRLGFDASHLKCLFSECGMELLDVSRFGRRSKMNSRRAYVPF